jgi:hypothetical protein
MLLSVYSISGWEVILWPLPQLLNLLPLVRLRTSPHSRHYGVTITGLLVIVFPAGHPRYGDSQVTPFSKSQLQSLHPNARTCKHFSHDRHYSQLALETSCKRMDAHLTTSIIVAPLLPEYQRVLAYVCLHSYARSG